ncbi:hypothetical protein [Rhodococcus jostii]|uniref:hypothetical protein n=1 Tax=Rhodococcus jostii TaxID=132919 RepID=UPI003631B4F1
MTDVSTKKNRLHRMRRWSCAPLVVAVAAGVICAGAGISTAATDTATPPATTNAPQGGASYPWTLLNRTNRTIYGSWVAKVQSSSAQSSHVEASVNHPWPPNEAATATQFLPLANASTSWTGDICYNKHHWHFYTESAEANQFRLEADSNNALYVYYTDVEPVFFGITIPVNYRVPLTLQGDCFE